MVFFKVLVTEKVDAHRFMTLASGDDGIAKVSVTDPGSNPDFVSNKELALNSETVIRLGKVSVWSVEAQEDIDAGSRIEVGTSGKVKASSGTGIGYVMEDVKQGELAKVVKTGAIGVKGDKGDDGDDGVDGFPTEQQWNELVGRVEELEDPSEP